MATFAIRPMHLLLLTPPPWPPESDTLRTALEAPLAATLEQVSFTSRKSSVGADLDIALPLPYLVANIKAARSSQFHDVQAIVAETYKLICIVAALKTIKIEDAEGINVRILLIAYTEQDHSQQQKNAGISAISKLGPVIDLQTLASSQRPWQTVYHIDNKEGEQILRRFLVSQDSRMSIRKVMAGNMPNASNEPQYVRYSYEDRERHHQSIAVGGTWDHIHIGHKLLLTLFAFLLDPRDAVLDRRLTIGITGDELLKNKRYPELLQSWKDRQHSVASFLSAIMDFRPSNENLIDYQESKDPGPNGHVVDMRLQIGLLVRLVEIWDPFGPTITDEAISALVISAETRSGGAAVNDKRKEKDWAQLKVFEVDVLNDNEESSASPQANELFRAKLSSTKVRENIDRRAKLRSTT